MATTGVDFVLITKTGSYASGAAVKAAPFVKAVESNSARNLTGNVPGGAATGVLGSTGLPNNAASIIIPGFSNQGFAKNGAFHATTSGTTAVSVDLTNLTTNATSSDGDTVFATASKVVVKNCGTADMTIAPGASNPASLPKFAGTTPTLTVAAGTEAVFFSDAGATVDSTHKIITITPVSGGDVVVAVGGA